jgi:mono/diheme cytochrome c family protein
MTKRRNQILLLSLAAVAMLLAALSPWIVQGYWSMRSTNPVRRGVARAGELGCFSCHGELGRAGLPDPGEPGSEVPSWNGGVWMMYVESDEQIRNYILYGSRTRPDRRESSDDHGDAHSHAKSSAGERAVHMPAYEAVLGSGDLEDLVAAFKVLAAMSLPPSGSPERRGYELARTWGCFACHGPAGSGGYPNPASFAGFVPGWYGADFRDLVRNREEFDAWVREGMIPRFADNPIASFFMRRQRVPMPAYKSLTSRERDDLWAYTRWLEKTDGGYKGGAKPW